MAAQCLSDLMLPSQSPLQEGGCGGTSRGSTEHAFLPPTRHELPNSCHRKWYYSPLTGKGNTDLAGGEQVPAPPDEVVPLVAVEVAAEAAHVAPHPGRDAELQEAHAVPEQPRA